MAKQVERFMRWRPTLPSRGRPTSGFACCRPPLMSNVERRLHTIMSHHQCCPVCGESSVAEIAPGTFPMRKPSHRCNACGAGLVTRLPRRAWGAAAIGVLLVIGVYGLYELSAPVEMLSKSTRALLAVTAIGGAFGFAASRVLRAVEFVVWAETP